MAKIAFLGLGVMGFPMAGHIQNAGHQVCVYNRTSTKAEKWVEQYGGSFATTPKEAARDADIVISCVGNDDDLRGIVYGENGALEGMKSGAIYVDNTTASADVAREIYGKAKESGVSFLDAPVSGGQAGAEKGVLSVMIGGDENAYQCAKPIIECYAQMATYMGEAGSGQLAKMVNQICIAGLVQGLSEGVHFAMQAGLDIPNLINTISKGAAGSWQMENRGETMAKGEFDFGFAVEWMRKDLGIVLEEAKRNKARLPVTAMVDQFYGQVEDMGGKRWDTSSLIALLNKK